MTSRGIVAPIPADFAAIRLESDRKGCGSFFGSRGAAKGGLAASAGLGGGGGAEIGSAAGIAASAAADISAPRHTSRRSTSLRASDSLRQGAQFCKWAFTLSAKAGSGSGNCLLVSAQVIKRCGSSPANRLAMWAIAAIWAIAAKQIALQDPAQQLATMVQQKAAAGFAFL